MLASGSAMPAALRAQQLLADDWGVAADVWSVTSWVELHRDGLRADDANLLVPGVRAADGVRDAVASRMRRDRSSPSRTTSGRSKS